MRFGRGTSSIALSEAVSGSSLASSRIQAVDVGRTQLLSGTPYVKRGRVKRAPSSTANISKSL